jgi:hypothetical protein
MWAKLSIGSIPRFLRWNQKPYVKIGLIIDLYKGSLLLVESFDLRPNYKHILVIVIPSCSRFANMCLRQLSPLRSLLSPILHGILSASLIPTFIFCFSKT